MTDDSREAMKRAFELYLQSNARIMEQLNRVLAQLGETNRDRQMPPDDDDDGELCAPVAR